jgi:hypothetical protein
MNYAIMQRVTQIMGKNITNEENFQYFIAAGRFGAGAYNRLILN